MDPRETLVDEGDRDTVADLLHQDPVPFHQRGAHGTGRDLERLQEEGVFIFRADVEVSTCGVIPPLHCLESLCDYIRPDVAILDYRLRGFIRDEQGHKLFNDEPRQAMQTFLSDSLQAQYHFKYHDLSSLHMAQMRMSKKPHLAHLNQYAPTKSPFQISQQVESEKKELFA